MVMEVTNSLAVDGSEDGVRPRCASKADRLISALISAFSEKVPPLPLGE
jgi:hypothetical protein